MPDEEFEKLVDEAIATIPKEFLEKLDNVSIFIEDLPSANQLRKLRMRPDSPFLFGLYEGIPQTKRRYYGVGATLPDKITIFKKPLTAVARTAENLKLMVKNTVWHEIAHHFGMDEQRVRKAEAKRRER